MKIFKLKIVAFLVCPIFLFGQTVSLEEITELAVAKNYLVKVQENNARIAEINTSAYARGYLPTLGLSGRTNYSLGNSLNRYSAIPEIRINNAGSLSGNMGLIGSYAVLTGGSRKYTNLKNDEILALSQIDLEQTKQELVFNASRLYYQIAKAQKGLEVLEESLNISQQRLEKAKYNFEFGQSSSIDTLNARVDINRDRLNIIRLTQQIDNLKRELNTLLCRDSSTPFEADTTIVLEYLAGLESWIDKSKTQNTGLQSLEKNVDLARIDESLAMANQLPTVQMDAGYNLSLVENNENSFLVFQRSNGFQVGLSLSWNIFDGGNTNIRKQTSRINTLNQDFQLKNFQSQLEKDISVLWSIYQTNLSIIKTEQVNIETAKQNFSRSEELFKRAQIGSVDFRQAQLNLLNAQLSYYNALFDAKINEVELKYLSGTLL
jgi:outer membrane protein TolC